jgi:hypothetical protein
MSNLAVNTITDAAGGSTAVLNGVVNAPGSMGFRNRLLNGDMQIAQRATSATVTAGTGAGTPGYQSVDRWFVYSTGANVTAAQVNGATATSKRLQITGAASVTAIGVGQRIEAVNCYDLADQTATLSVDLANSLLTTVTWTANYATTTDTFGTIGTPTKTQIATGTFTVSSTVTRFTTQISIPSAAITGIEIVFTVGAQTSGTFTIGNCQLEVGSVATPFERRPFGTELALCQRYYQKMFSDSGVMSNGYNLSTTAGRYTKPFIVAMRTKPTALETTGTAANYRILTNFATALSVVPAFSSASEYEIEITGTVSSGLTAGQGSALAAAATTNAFLAWSAEL